MITTQSIGSVRVNPVLHESTDSITHPTPTLTLFPETALQGSNPPPSWVSVINNMSTEDLINEILDYLPPEDAVNLVLTYEEERTTEGPFNALPHHRIRINKEYNTPSQKFFNVSPRYRSTCI